MVLHFFFCFLFFFFNDTATTEIYTLSLHDALPICTPPRRAAVAADPRKDPLGRLRRAVGHRRRPDRLLQAPGRPAPRSRRDPAPGSIGALKAQPFFG